MPVIRASRKQMVRITATILIMTIIMALAGSMDAAGGLGRDSGGRGADFDGTEEQGAECHLASSCSECIAMPHCGFCMQEMAVIGRPEEVAVLEEIPKVSACIPANQSSVDLASKSCAFFSSSHCPCPNSCSGHGLCTVDGICSCHRSYEGIHCGTRRESIIRQSFVVPIALLLASSMIVCIVSVHVANGVPCMLPSNRSAWQMAAFSKSGKDEGIYGQKGLRRR